MNPADHKLQKARSLDELESLPLDATFNPEEARIYAHLKSRQAIYNWLNDRDDPLPASKIGGWRIIKRNLDAYLKKKHNRRASDQALEQHTSDMTLRQFIGQLIEISQAVIIWRRATIIYRAASDSALKQNVDVGWLNKTFDEMINSRDRLCALTNSLSDERLTSLRFMLPSIHSTLALSESFTEESAATEINPASKARSRR